MNLIKYFYSSFLIFLIFSSCDIENNPVQILSLTASDSIIVSGEIVTLVCLAEDEDGDALRYSWDSSLGTVISGNKDSAQWTAPEEAGYHMVTCKVSDENGSSDALGISIKVIPPLSYIQGTVSNALNGGTISEAIVTINGIETLTNTNGLYTIYTNITSGQYEVSGSSDAFCTYNGNFQIPEEYPENAYIFNFSLSPIPEIGEIRMVLNWGENPSDLDSHLKTPPIENQEYHIYYGNRGSDDSIPYATLDFDVVTGYGPETMTIKQSFSGNYIYYIKHYSGSGSLSESRGTIQIYNSPDCEGETIYVPIEGDGLFWYVCNINGDTGEITVINELQDSEPTQ